MRPSTATTGRSPPTRRPGPPGMSTRHRAGDRVADPRAARTQPTGARSPTRTPPTSPARSKPPGPSAAGPQPPKPPPFDGPMPSGPSGAGGDNAMSRDDRRYRSAEGVLGEQRLVTAGHHDRRRSGTGRELRAGAGQPAAGRRLVGGDFGAITSGPQRASRRRRRPATAARAGRETPCRAPSRTARVSCRRHPAPLRRCPSRRRPRGRQRSPPPDGWPGAETAFSRTTLCRTQVRHQPERREVQPAVPRTGRTAGSAQVGRDP
jgi:hypothetical protein